MRLLLALAALLAGACLVWAAPEGQIDPSNATLKVGKLRIEDDHPATVIVTVQNVSQAHVDLIAVTCTAFLDEEPIEIEHGTARNVAAGETVYLSVEFPELKGNATATATCRIEFIEANGEGAARETAHTQELP